MCNLKYYVIRGALLFGYIYNLILQTPSNLLLRECRSKTADKAKVRRYLESNKDVVNIRDEDKVCHYESNSVRHWFYCSLQFEWTPLMWACENKHFEIAKLILKYRPDVNIQDKVCGCVCVGGGEYTRLGTVLYRKSGLL